jgi:hypothetical protein
MPQRRRKMSVEKMDNIKNIIDTHESGTVSARKRHDVQPKPPRGDVVSVEHSDGARDLKEIYRPPFFPIGDTQSIFKIQK